MNFPTDKSVIELPITQTSGSSTATPEINNIVLGKVPDINNIALGKVRGLNDKINNKSIPKMNI